MCWVKVLCYLWLRVALTQLLFIFATLNHLEYDAIKGPIVKAEEKLLKIRSFSVLGNGASDD